MGRNPFGAIAETSVLVSIAWYQGWLQSVNQYRLTQEATLQQELLETGSADDQRFFARIKHLSPAVRAFFDQNRALVMMSGNPYLHEMILQRLRAFVYNFQHVEHEVKKDLGVPLQVWTAEDHSYRDDLGQLAGEDPVTYQLVANAGLVPQGARLAGQQLAGQVQARHQKAHSSGQMN